MVRATHREIHRSQRIGWLLAAVLTTLGALAARAGGAPVIRASLRVVFWGALAMALTAGAGMLFGAAT